MTTKERASDYQTNTCYRRTDVTGPGGEGHTVALFRGRGFSAFVGDRPIGRFASREAAVAAVINVLDILAERTP